MIDVSFMDTESSDAQTVNHGERVQVHGENVECTALSAEGLGNILSNLPDHMREKVNTVGHIHYNTSDVITWNEKHIVQYVYLNLSYFTELSI